MSGSVSTDGRRHLLRRWIVATAGSLTIVLIAIACLVLVSLPSLDLTPVDIEVADIPGSTAGWWMVAPARFVFGVGLGTVAVSAIVFRCLEVAYREAGPEPLSLATWITVARGSVTAVIVGFVFAPPAAGPAAWVPGLLFAFAVVLDSVDGLLARATDSSSAVGNRLDVEMDSFTVFVGVLLAIRIGDVPIVFLLVGVARYLFLAGFVVRRRRGLPVVELTPSERRRVVGAATMLGIALVLFPIPGAEITWWIAAMVTFPVVVSFGRDWLTVSGRFPSPGNG